MLIRFLSNRTRLNILQLIFTSIVLYALSIRFEIMETIIITILILLINLLTHTKAVAMGMQVARINDKLLNKLFEIDEKKRNKK